MSIPTQQKALLLPSKGADFTLGTVEVPKPEAGEVLVRVEAAGLNPLDYKIQELGFFISEFPAILGCDASGVVAAVGNGVTALAIGDKVLFETNPGYRNAAFQQFTIIKASLTSKIPAKISFDEAATLPCCLMTAANGLYTGFVPHLLRGGASLTPFWAEGGRGKYAGQPIVIFGGAASVGQYAIQLARISGFSPIITTASLRNAERLKSIGATHVIDRGLSQADIIAKVKEITAKPVHVVYDAVGIPETQNTGYDIIAPGGTLLVVLPPAVDQEKITSDKHLFMVMGSVDLPEYEESGAGLFRVLPELLASGQIKPNVPGYIPGGLSGITEGLEKLKRNEVSAKKLVVRPSETI
ncbi:unnamed protein product [Somion occarium]|uniref:Enoyl reductase (ER) domain-containing protein n=1 Tax=Somion occarium TaxID=3059160 RepID=A0ABP1DVG2_9APHY